MLAAISAWSWGAPASSCCLMMMSRPTSVSMNAATAITVIAVVSASMPNQRGHETTFSNVALGDVSMPTKRCTSDSGAAPPDEADGGCVIG